MHRFYVSPQDINDRQIWLDLEQSRHIDRVLRLGPGDRVIIFDGLGQEYEVQLSGLHNGRVEGEIIQMLGRAAEPALRINLVQGIAKGEKMDFIIQKAVELGAFAIYPFFSQHAVVKLEKERAVKKQERWQAIAREACKQCRRSRIPTVHPPGSLPSILEMMDGRPAIMLYENETRQGLKELLNEKRPSLQSEQELFLMIGPEGGFAPAEVEMARARGVVNAGLGPRILRTETAALAALTIVLYELADLGSGQTSSIHTK
jgi:16S rRNA (uracil1498-N3)-methyltransferase